VEEGTGVSATTLEGATEDEDPVPRGKAAEETLDDSEP
jgi:hypothetical protein